MPGHPATVRNIAEDALPTPAGGPAVMRPTIFTDRRHMGSDLPLCIWLRCIDRMLLTFRQPRLQYGKGIHGFFCHHRGYQFVSSALMLPMTERFAADIRHYIDARGLDLIHFAKGQSKDEIARRYLAGHGGGE